MACLPGSGPGRPGRVHRARHPRPALHSSPASPMAACSLRALCSGWGSAWTACSWSFPAWAPRRSATCPRNGYCARDELDFTGLSVADEGSFGAIAVIQTQDKLEAWKKSILPGIAVADNRFVSRLENNYEFSFDITRLPKPFMKPALLLLGRQDNICGYRDAWRTLENYPRATFVVLDRAGHCLGPGMEEEQSIHGPGSELAGPGRGKFAPPQGVTKA